MAVVNQFIARGTPRPVAMFGRPADFVEVWLRLKRFPRRFLKAVCVLEKHDWLVVSNTFYFP